MSLQSKSFAQNWGSREKRDVDVVSPGEGRAPTSDCVPRMVAASRLFPGGCIRDSRSSIPMLPETSPAIFPSRWANRRGIRAG
jgi:hypothetical protein